MLRAIKIGSFCINVVVTLFELMVMNNWWIIMEGFHAAVGDKSARIFFIVFHVINVVSYTSVAYISTCIYIHVL